MEPDLQDDPLAAQIAFLHSISLFSQLNDTELCALAGDFISVKYAKGEAIFWHGDTSTEFYLVCQGKVRIYKVSPGGRKTSINLFAAGDIIGEFAAVDHQPRSATAQAITDCLVWKMDGDVFVDRLCEMPNLSLALNRLLVKKLRWTAEFAETMAQYDAAGRLLHLLLLYNQQFGKTLEVGKSYDLELGLTQGDMASLVGTNYEWVNRLLQDWRRRGWLTYKSGTITIYDLPALQRERNRRLKSKYVKRETGG